MLLKADGNLAGRRLVVFGCGYVGAAVASRAHVQGMRVAALTRNETKAAALRELGVETVVADLADDSWHSLLTGRADWVLNCVSSGGGGLEAYERSYVKGSAAILAWLRKTASAQTVIYTGSTSVFPQGDGAVVDENSPADASNDRARLLIEAERLVQEAAIPVDGMIAADRWFVLRLAGIYGPGRSHLIDQVKAGRVAGAGSHRLNLVHRDDIVSAIMAAFAAPPEVRNEVINICDDCPTPKDEIVRWLVARTGCPEPSYDGLPVRNRGGATPDRIVANAKAARLLGWRPKYPSFREGYENLLSH